MNKIRKERQSEARWLKQQRKLSRDYCFRLQREKKEKEAKESEEKRTGYAGDGNPQNSPLPQ